jgi:LysR family transcriptional activator of dmlA
MAHHNELTGHNPPDVTELRVFCAAARTSNFAAAARELAITPTYVSKRIAALERRLGVALFRRTTRRVHITEEGELAYAWARRILDDLHAMTDEVSSTRNAPRGPLRISTSLRLGRDHVAPALSLLAKEYPALDIWLELVDRRIDLIGEEIDIDIRVGDVTEPHLIAHRIVRSNRILCAAPRYLERNGAPKTLADLGRHQCMQFRDRVLPFGVWRMEGPSGPEVVRVTGRLGSNHSDIVLGWAIDGHGVILLSDWDIAQRIEAGTMVRILPAYRQPADVFAVTAKSQRNSAKVRLAIEFISRQLTAGPLALNVA